MFGGWRRLLLVATALFAVACGVAYATIPGGGGVYTACMLRNVGTVRLIDTSLPPSNLMSHCTSLETQVTWNQEGQPGAQGLPGAKGADGAAGKDGKDGKDGQSVTQAPADSSACPTGGVTLTAANGAANVCNGARGPAGAGSSVYHASVYANGLANAVNSPEFVSSTRIGTGLYDVSFSVPTGDCGRVATLGIPTDQHNSSDFFKGFKGEISTFFDLRTNSIAVATFDSDGNPADQDFQLVVAC
jgi:hypothetical protein